MSTRFPTPPEILIDGVGEKRASEALLSVLVHARGDRADARVEVSGHQTEVLPRGFELGTTELGVRMGGEDVFRGRLDEVELRAPDGAPTSLLLVASGTSPVDSTGEALPVQYGKELVDLSVRHRAGGTTARGVLTTSDVRCGTRLEVAAPDPAFDAIFTVVELWHRFDAAQGARIEFLAEA